MTVLKYWDQATGQYHTVSGPPGPVGPQGLIQEAPLDGYIYGRQGSTASWLSGGELSGSLTVDGKVTVYDGQVFGSQVAASVDDLTHHLALYGGGNAGDGSYGFSITGGTLNIVSGSQAVIQAVSSPSAYANINGGLNISGTTQGQSINGTSLNSSGSVTAQGGGWYYHTYPGVRQWLFGCQNDGSFWIYDNSSGLLPLYCTGGNGNTVLNYSVTVGSNLQVNGTMHSNSDTTVSGNFYTNAISCSSLTCAGITSSQAINCTSASNAIYYSSPPGYYQWYWGGMSNNEFYITCNSRGDVCLIIDTGGTTNLNGHWLYSGAINTGYIDLTNGVGMSYAQQGSGHRIAFTNTGTQLTHYINGGAAGSWNFNAPSDEGIKANIGEPEGNALEDLLKVRLISFDETAMRDARFQPTHIRWGFSAQRMQKAIPEAVNIVEIWEEGTRKELLNIDIMPLMARAIGAIQTLSARLEALEKRA